MVSRGGGVGAVPFLRLCTKARGPRRGEENRMVKLPTPEQLRGISAYYDLIDQLVEPALAEPSVTYPRLGGDGRSRRTQGRPYLRSYRVLWRYAS